MTAATPNLPNLWGPGQLLAFSGLDGHTDHDRPFVLHTGAALGELTLRLPAAAEMGFQGLPALETRLLLGDCFEATGPAGRLGFAFADHHTLAGEMPQGATLVAGGAPVTDEPRAIATGMGLKVFACVRGSRWCLLAAEDEAQVAGRVDAALAADLDRLVAERSRYVREFQVPARLDSGDERLLRKAVSVMKVNTEAPCGRIGRRWTTPDRWPHRHMWLWDSAFHGIGLSYVDSDLGKDAVLAMLEQVQPDGMLPHMVLPNDPPSKITQPPVLAWSVLRLLQATEDQAWAAECIPYLMRYLDWMRLNRDRNGNGLPEWFIEGEPLCRCGECGLDNSPRFDAATLLDATDFSSLLASDYDCLAQIARQVGEQKVAEACEAYAERIRTAVNELLWSEKAGLYMDRDFEGRLSEVKAVTGFFPLFAGIPSADRAERLRQHLHDPRTFAAPMPIPSVSLDSGRYSKDMWRGPAWINTNYLVCSGLRRYGFSEEADRLKEQTLAEIRRWYEIEGCVFEYYDSLGITSPSDLDRKQRLISGKGIAPISDYHWTAALTAAWLME